MEVSNGDVAAVSFRAIKAETVHLDDLPALRSAVESATDSTKADTGGIRALSISGLPDFLDALQPQLDAVRSASFAVTAQLVLLAWFVLFLVIAATGDERSGEIALAKLRGMTPRSTLFFGLAEPLILLVAALPLGLALAYAADVFLTTRYLGPGTAVTLSPSVLVALAVCFLGGAAAAALAARGILTAPVLEQLRRTAGRRAKLVRSTAIDAAAVALAAAGIYELNRGGSDSLALVAPGLIALAAGLLAVRALPWFARVEVNRTRQSRDVASFLSSRNIARRPSGLRIVVLLSLAVGLAVFAVDGWTVAAANRADLARADVGAAEVLHVHAASPGALLSAVAKADPSGTQAMAATSADNGAGGLLAVDSARLGAVAAWDPDVGRRDPQRHRRGAPPAAADEAAARAGQALAARHLHPHGGRHARQPHRRGARGQRDPEPGAARHAGHRARRRTPPTSRPVSTPRAASRRSSSPTRSASPRWPSRARSTSRGATDVRGPVDLTSVGQSGWRSGAAAIGVPIEGGAQVVSLKDGVLQVALDFDFSEDAAIEVADHPRRCRSSRARTARATRPARPTSRSCPASTAASSPRRRSARRPAAAAQLGHDGRPALRDRRDGHRAEPARLPGVALADGVPRRPDALVKQGLDVVSVDTIAEREAELDRSGGALSLRLFLLAAVVALILGAGTLLANAYVVIRRRAYELAALRALGAPRSRARALRAPRAGHARADGRRARCDGGSRRGGLRAAAAARVDRCRRTSALVRPGLDAGARAGRSSSSRCSWSSPTSVPGARCAARCPSC